MEGSFASERRRTLGECVNEKNLGMGSLMLRGFAADLQWRVGPAVCLSVIQLIRPTSYVAAGVLGQRPGQRPSSTQSTRAHYNTGISEVLEAAPPAFPHQSSVRPRLLREPICVHERRCFNSL